VMRHALLRMMVGVTLGSVFCPGAGSFESGAMGPVAEARKRIKAGNYAAAVPVLEDALATSPRTAQPEIFELLQQAYGELIKQAEAAGRSREAAHFRENLEIVARARGLTPKAPVTIRRPESVTTPVSRPASPRDVPRPGPLSGDLAPANNSRVMEKAPKNVPASSPVAGSLLEPAQLPEPAALPAPGSSAPLADRPAPDRSPSLAKFPKTVPRQQPAQGNSETPTPGNAPSTPASPASDPSVPASAPLESQPAAEPDQKPVEQGTGEADRLFVAHRYEEAGSRYAALSRQNLLPGDRKQHWAYCRKVAVVRRINSHPRSAREWDEIEVEIQRIQQLMPNNWFGEYLKSYVAEARRSGRLPSAPGAGVVVRGSAPEEQDSPPPRFQRFLNRAKGTVAPAQPAPSATSPSVSPSPAPNPAAEQPLELPVEEPKQAESQPPPAPNEPEPTLVGTVTQPELASSGLGITVDPPAASPAIDRALASSDNNTPANVIAAQSDPATNSQQNGKTVASAPDQVTWQVYETPNFRIYHADPELAQKAGEVAELVRLRQAERWASPAARAAWTPRCDFYLYANGKHFAKSTGQTETAPGFSTMGTSGNKVVTRLIHLRADHPELLAAVLPHEVTHVVMADLFAVQQIPRWADEGLAVLAEPVETQRLRSAELKEPLESGGLIDLGKLMTMDYPAPNHLSLYYAQSISLTRFLVGQGPPEQFLKFVRHSQRGGVELALKEVYQIQGLAALEDRWLAYARGQFATRTASASERVNDNSERFDR
jgi:hypothetical protein